MNKTLVLSISACLLALAVAACSSAPLPPAKAPTTDVNPITGSRGGGGAR